MKEQLKLFLTNHKCKLCVCSYCHDKDICTIKNIRCMYMCTYKPHITCGAKEYFGVYNM